MRNKKRHTIRNKNSIMTKKPRVQKQKNHKVKNAQKVILDGIQFQSNLEKTMYLKLKDSFIYGKEFFYESSSVTLIESFNFENEIWVNKKSDKSFIKESLKARPMTYKPDFSSHSDLSEATWIIECKGKPNDRWPVVFKLFKLWLSINNPKCKIYCPANVNQCEITINKIKEL